MKILYLGRHGQPNNDDEGAISWSLRKLGHSVVEVQETITDISNKIEFSDFDFFLFHKSPPQIVSDISTRLSGVCWFFDPLRKGFTGNDHYIAQVEPHCFKMFFTDGDFVPQSSKFNLLRQGFDSREIKMVDSVTPTREVSFLGHINHEGYNQRADLCRSVDRRYGEKFICDLGFNIFKEQLTQYCQQTKIMLGMPPVTDRYWSNRIYILGGRGAFVVHPYASELEKDFPDMPMFRGEDGLCNIIDYYLQHDDERLEIRKKIQTEIVLKHKYIDRCKELIEEISI